MALTLTKEQATDLETRMAQSRHDWERHTAALANDVQSWAEQEEATRGWRVEREEKELAEESIGGAYRVPILTIHSPQGELILEPVARALPPRMKAQGRVDLYAWPSMYRVMLLHRQPKRLVMQRSKRQGRVTSEDRPLEWVARTESGLDWPQPWNRDTFLTLAEGLLKA